MVMNGRNIMFNSRIPKEKDEDEDDLEMAGYEGSNFNLENILKNSNGSSDAATVSSGFRDSGALYKGSHRRRKTAPQSRDEEQHESPGRKKGSRYRGKDRYHDDDERAVLYRSPRHSNLTEVLARNFKIPFVLLLILMFWGPMMLQSREMTDNRKSISRVLSHAYRKKDPEDSRLVDESGKEEELEGRDFENEEEEDVKLSNPVLKALRAVQNTDFVLPNRLTQKEEVDDNFRPESLSEDEQKELQIQVNRLTPKRHQMQNKFDVEPKSMEKPLKQEQQILSPLQQYQLRTQQEEQLQLKHYEEQQQEKLRPQPIPQQPLQQQQQWQDQQQARQLAQQQRQARQQQAQQQWQPPPPQKVEQALPQRIQQPLPQQFQQPPPQKIQQTPPPQQFQHPPPQKIQQAPPPQQFQQPPPQKIQQAPPQKQQVQQAPPQKQQVQQQVAQAPKIFNYKHADRPELIPYHFEDSFANVWDPPNPSNTPVFWHIPKNGGTTVADILTHCVSLVTASNIGATEGHGQENTLQVRTYHDKGKYINVNTASIPGIKHAKEMGLASSGLADMIVMHRLHEGSELFDSDHKARVFALFRNPIHRAVSMFYYLQKAKWEPTYDPTLADMSLLQYTNSNKVEENWVTRFIVHHYTGRLTPEHLEEAKQVMRNKMIVGLLDNFQDSLKRFELYFDWWGMNKAKGTATHMVQCQQNHERTAQNKVSHPFPDESDPAYKRLLQLNWADMQLYEYAKELYAEQGVFIEHKDAAML